MPAGSAATTDMKRRDEQRDIADHPERMQAFDSALANRLQALVARVEVDLDAVLSPDDE